MAGRRGRKGKQGGKQGSGKQAASSTSSAQSGNPAPLSLTRADQQGHHNGIETPELILTSDKRRGVYECDYCGADISQAPRIRCSVCDDFDVCCDCFATTDPATALARLRAAHAMLHTSGGASTKVMHDPFSHGYRVCDSTRYPLFPVRSGVKPPSLVKKTITPTSTAMVVADAPMDTEAAAGINAELDAMNDAMNDVMDTTTTTTTTPNDAVNEPVVAEAPTEPTTTVLDTVIMQAGDDLKTIWTVEEDLRLLQAIQAHGLGNWTDISEAVAGQGSQGKTPKRCMERYFDDFMGRYGHILPPYTLISETTMTAPDDDEEDDGGPPSQTSGEALENTSTLPDGVGGGGGAAATPSKDETPTSTSTAEATRSSKRRAAMLRSPSQANANTGPVKKYQAVLTETLPEYQKIRPTPYLPVLDSGPVHVGQEVGRDQVTRAEQAYVRAISSMDSKDAVERIRKDWELNRLNKPGGPTVLPMRPDDVPTMAGSELAGFMPRRGDFDVEWENNAEEAIADMEFIPGESEQDRHIKLQVLAIYNSKLDEREKRKAFVLSRKLYDYRQYQQEYQKLPTDERDLVHRMRLFERFHTPAEHRVFIDDLLKAKRLRKEIARLQMYRRMGIRTLLEAERFELDKARRQFHRNAALQKEAEAKKAEAATAGITVLDTRAGGAIADDSESSHYWKQYRTTDRKVRKSVNRGSAPEETNEARQGGPTPADSSQGGPTPADSSHGPTPADATVTTTTEPVPLATAPDAMDVDVARGGPPSPAKEAAVPVDTKPPPLVESRDNVDMSSFPGFAQLSAREVDLCRSIRLLPAQYLEIKKALIYESLTHGLLDDPTKHLDDPNRNNPNKRKRTTGPSFRPTLVKMDVERRGAIIDFVVRAGWISTQFGKSVRDHV